MLNSLKKRLLTIQFGGVLFFLMLFPLSARAAVPPTVTIALPKPVGETQVVLSDLAIDITPDLSAVPGYSADAKIRFAAPKTQAAAVTVTLPAWMQNMTLTSEPATIWDAKTQRLSLRPGHRGWLVAHRQEALPVGAVIHWQLSLAALDAWPGPLKSARITFHFPQNVTDEVLLSVQPEGRTFTGNSLHWWYEHQKLPAQFSVLLLKPSLWKRLQSERAPAKSGDVEAMLHQGRDAAKITLDPALPSRYFTRYYQEAIAALLTITQKQPQNSEAWQLLSQLYLAQGNRSSSQRQSYLSLAADALHQSWLANRNDAKTQRQLLSTYSWLIEQSRDKGDFAGALLFLQQLTDLLQQAPMDNPPDLARWQQQIIWAWVRQRLQAGDFHTAQQIIRQYWGDTWQQQLLNSAPRFQEVYIKVYTDLFHSRTIQVEVLPYPNLSDSWIAAWQQDIESLRAQAKNNVSSNIAAGVAYLTITLPANDADQLRRQQQALGEALSQDVVWAPLRSVLLDGNVGWGEERSQFRTNWHYREHVPLTTAHREMETALATALSVSSFPPVESLSKEEMQMLQSAYGKEAAGVWQRLMRNVQVEYVLQTPSAWPGSMPEERHWRAALGQEMVIFTQGTVYRPLPLEAAAAAGLLVWFFLWLWLRRQVCHSHADGAIQEERSIGDGQGPAPSV